MDGGPSRPSAPERELRRCDEEAIVSVSSAGLGHGIELLIGAFGLYVALAGLYFNIPSGNLAGAFICQLIGWPIVLFVAIAGGPQSLHIEPATQSYQEEQGWKPIRKVSKGRAEEFERLSLLVYMPRGKGTTLYLHWRDPNKKPLALHSDTWQEAHQYGLKVAALLGLPFADQRGQPLDETSLPPWNSNRFHVSRRHLRGALKRERIVLGSRSASLIAAAMCTVFLVLGLFFTIGPLLTSGGTVSNMDFVMLLPGPLVTIAAGLCLYLSLGWRDHLIFDPVSGVILRENGVYPFVTRKECRLDTFDQLVMEWKLGVTPGGMEYLAWQLRPLSRTETLPTAEIDPFTVGISGDKFDRREITELAEHFARRVGLPLEVRADA